MRATDPILLTTSPFINAYILRVHSFNKYYFSIFYKEDSLLWPWGCSHGKPYQVPALIKDVTQHTGP